MVMPTKIHTISREANPSYSFHDQASSADLQQHRTYPYPMTTPKYARTIHMASQYYFLPVDESRYDQRWVFTPSRGRAPSNTGASIPSAAHSNSTTLDDDIFEVLCRKVTDVHDDSDGENDDDIDFEPVESPPRRTVSISNSSVMDDDSGSKDGFDQGDQDDKAPSPCLVNDIDNVLDQDFEGINFDEDVGKKTSSIIVHEESQGHFDDIDDSSRTSLQLHLQCSMNTGTKDDTSEYEDDDASEKVAKKRSSAAKKSTPRKKTAGKSKRKTKAVESKDPSNQPPLRALSAYNFFFRDERERLLYNVSMILDDEKCRKLLQEHWHRDRTQKRRHRKTHGKIPFTQLSKIVSSQWKKLTEDQKDFYRGVSAKDWARYQKEMEEYKAKQDESEHEGEESQKSIPGGETVALQHFVQDTSCMDDDTQEAAEVSIEV